MKNLLLILLVLVFCAGCQKEEFTVVQTDEEASFLQDTELTALLKGVSSHDGSFDDVIDQAPCFSIDFPYQILLNNESHNVNSVEDLLAILPSDEVVPVFPISITYATYDPLEISSLEALAEQINLCNTGVLFNERITCVDIVYPIHINLYNPETSNFETVVYDHDKKTFQSISSYTNDQLASISFPITITTADQGSLSITSNEILKSQILSQVPLCE